MKSTFQVMVLLIFVVLSVLGCEVNQEKIELWKQTQNGPTKLASAMIDTKQPLEIRAKAGVALSEIRQKELFRESFTKMSKDDGDEVIAAITPLLQVISRGENPANEQNPTSAQIDAKDALYRMYDFAGPKSKPLVVNALVSWCTEGNFNKRAHAGDFRVEGMVKKIGVPAADALVQKLTYDQIAIEPIAHMIRSVKDDGVMARASTQLADQLQANVGKFGETQLVSAAIIGGDPVANVLIDLATNPKLSAELQRFALRAFSMSYEKGNVAPNPKWLERIFPMAEDENFDQFHREETYLTIAQIGQKEEAERVAKLLKEEDFFWRLVGLRCLLRMDGEGQLAKTLSTKKLARSEQEIGEVVYWATQFPKLTETFRGLLNDKDTFVVGVSIYALATHGNKEKDLPALQAIADSRAKLPAGFDHATVGEAATAAIESIQKKG